MEHNFFFIALALWLFLDVLWIFARPAFNLISITGSGKALFSFYLLFITFFFFFFRFYYAHKTIRFCPLLFCRLNLTLMRALRVSIRI